MNPVRDEIHIASLVVHALADRAEAVSAAISALPGGQVHAASAVGKLVVTLEADGDAGMLAQIDAIQRMRGVLTATLVYQCADSREAMEQEVPDGAGPT